MFFIEKKVRREQEILQNFECFQQCDPPQIKLYMHGIMHKDKGHFWPFIISTPFFLACEHEIILLIHVFPNFILPQQMHANEFSVFKLAKHGLTPMMSPFGRLNFYASDFKITYLRAKLDTGF